MRLVFVNHVHPDSGLVAGLRLWRFAQELAKRGHRVVFLTENITPAPADVGSRFCELAANHDWRAPLVLACGESGSSPRHRSSRNGGKVPILGKVRTASDIAFRGGVFWRWRKAAERECDAILRTFEPEVAYATFGNLDALNVARTLARRGRIPWVMDIKDPLAAFVPRSLQGLVRLRYADASAVTFNSEFQRTASFPLIGRGGEVIYSGADVAGPHCASDEGSAGEKHPFFTLVGSLYSDDRAETLLRAFANFAAQQQQKDLPEPRLRYFGGDHDRVRRLVRQLGSPQGICVHERIPRIELLSICRTARANCYVASERTFHHKLFELLAAGRPVIAYPFERAESIAVAQRVGARLEVCTTPTQLVDAWTRIANEWNVAPATALAGGLGWDGFAAELEALFENLVHQRSVGIGTPVGGTSAQRGTDRHP